MHVVIFYSQRRLNTPDYDIWAVKMGRRGRTPVGLLSRSFISQCRRFWGDPELLGINR